MKIFIIPALFLTLTACPSKQDVASASAIPAYLVAGEAVLKRNATNPLSPEALVALKAADERAYAAASFANDGQVKRAAEVHALVQGL